MRVLLVAYDNDDYIGSFPIGLGFIAAAIEKTEHSVDIYQQDIHHYSPEHLAKVASEYDVVGTGMCAGYYQYAALKKIAEAVKVPLIVGGPMVTATPEYFLHKGMADIVVMGEGDLTIVDLLDNMDNLGAVEGIAYRNGDQVVVNPRRAPAVLSELPWPSYDLFDIEHYRLQKRQRMANSEFSIPIMTARGCPFRCNFCYQMEPKFRTRDVADIVSEMKFLREEYNISHFFFADDLLMSSKKRAFEFSEAVGPMGIKWDCSGRLNYATDDVMHAMADAGCVFVNYGVESFNDDMLKVMNKNLTTQQILAGVKATLKAGISPGINVIWGNIGETKEHLWNSVNFVLEYSDAAQKRTVKPVTPYPGSALYCHALEKGLLTGPEDFYENKHTNSDLMAVNLTDLSDEEFYEELGKANHVLIEDYYKKNCVTDQEIMAKLYSGDDTNFRGFRRS